jgi:hypothetical protein
MGNGLTPLDIQNKSALLASNDAFNSNHNKERYLILETN